MADTDDISAPLPLEPAEASQPVGHPPKTAPDKGLRKKGGPVGRDWEALYHQWTESNLDRIAFLKSVGVSATSPQTWRKTKGWELRFMGKTPAKRANALRDARLKVAEMVPNTPEVDQKQVMAILGMKGKDVNPNAMARGWQLIMKWREAQAIDDHRTADSVRQIAKIIMANSIKKTTLSDGSTKVETTMRASDLRQISMALESTQRIQRLSLGLSTDNIGINDPGNGDNARDVTPDDSVPTFEVIMSKNGRFTTARPRRIK